jgi:hypothetical protein
MSRDAHLVEELLGTLAESQEASEERLRDAALLLKHLDANDFNIWKAAEAAFNVD